MSGTPIKKLRQTAIQWFLRIQDPHLDDSARQQFESWLMQSPSHQQAYAEVSRLWDRFDSPVALEKLATAMDQKSFFEKAERSSRVKKSVASALAACAIGLASLLSYQHWQAQPVMQFTAQANLGEVSSKRLEDGSLLTMGAGTDIQVTYYRDRRMVTLKRGEAIFEVSRDPARPFIIDSGFARISVLGTRFAVNRMQKCIRISVDHGLVKVDKQNTQGDTSASLALHQSEVAEVRIDENNVIKTNHQAKDAFSFEKGVITFDKAGLDEIAETLSRYRKTPVIAQQASSQHQITAVIKTSNIDTFLKNLPEMAPVKVTTTRERTLISANASKK